MITRISYGSDYVVLAMRIFNILRKKLKENTITASDLIEWSEPHLEVIINGRIVFTTRADYEGRIRIVDEYIIPEIERNITNDN